MLTLALNTNSRYISSDGLTMSFTSAIVTAVLVFLCSNAQTLCNGQFVSPRSVVIAPTASPHAAQPPLLVPVCAELPAAAALPAHPGTDIDSAYLMSRKTELNSIGPTCTQVAIGQCIYAKSLTLAHEQRAAFGTGAITSFMQVDAHPDR
eukprot:scaffold103804_cov40-Phaeocystis_antarctica.AAC.4